MANENNKRIAKNTLMLYFRMLLTMGVSLYTSRVVLEVLGVEDFGIYNVVGGVVAMFSILCGSLSSAISRFLTYELGKKDYEKLKKIFSSAVTIQIILSLIVFVLAESIGIWFLNAKMNIPIERLRAANWVFQCSVITFIVNLLNVPFNAVIIAHEQMKVFAYVSILDALLKLVIAYVLFISSFDKLIVYALLLLMVSVIIRLVYNNYCKRHFNECTYQFVFERTLFNEIFKFAGWNFIGSSSAVLREHGVNVLLNLFCGPVVNAAKGIAVQVNSAVNGFASNFITALKPQIIKSYASGDYKYLMTLVQQGARFSFYMLLFLSLPVIMDTETVLNIWLKNVPVHTVNFVRLTLIFVLSESISGTLITAMSATGKIKKYQLIVGGLQILNFPISYLLLRIGLIPEITMLTAIFLSQICLMARLWLLRGMINLSARYYLRYVYGNVLIVSVLSICLPYLVFINMETGIIRFVCVTIMSVISTTSMIFIVGCSSQERLFVWNKVKLFIFKK